MCRNNNQITSLTAEVGSWSTESLCGDKRSPGRDKVMQEFVVVRSVFLYDCPIFSIIYEIQVLRSHVYVLSKSLVFVQSSRRYLKLPIFIQQSGEESIRETRG